MKYSVFEVGRLYCSAFREFTNGRLMVDRDNGYGLFVYCIKSIYGVETNEYSVDISRYSTRCIDYLRGVRGVPRRPERMKYRDRYEIVSICTAMYASLTVVERGSLECRLGCQS